jgi:hypothetical protein
MAANKILSDCQQIEDESFKYFQEALLKFREIDDDRQLNGQTPAKSQKGDSLSSATKDV